tara:strand:+ start:248 stop:619 length:372 start_codon:yes stop_codon:yes gene_type:complete
MKILKTFYLLTIFFLFFQNHSLASSSQQVDKISKNLRCLICQGQSVYDSQSDFALSMKTLIKKKIDEGKNDDEIYDFLISKYGEWIVYEPKFKKNTIFLWLLPILVFFVGGLIIFKKTKFFKL